MSTDDLLLWLQDSAHREHEAAFAKGRRFIKQQRAEVTAELEKRGIFGELSRVLADQIDDVDGHADIWKVFLSADILGRAVAGMAGPFEELNVTKVAGVEARGFLLGGAVAVHLAAGFVAIRKPGSLLPGPKVARMTALDYKGRSLELRLQKQALRRGDRVLLVDDWVETGSTALAARALVEELGGTFVGVSTLVDQLPEGRTPDLGTYRALVRFPSGHVFGPKRQAPAG